MGNTPEGGNHAPTRTFDILPDMEPQVDRATRNRAPTRRAVPEVESQKSMARSKSMHNDNSQHKLASVNTSFQLKAKCETDMLLTDLQKGSFFCNHFMLTCLELKMNANINAYSNYLNEKEGPQDVSRHPTQLISDKGPSRFDHIVRKFTENDNDICIQAVRKNERDTVLEVEVAKIRLGTILQENQSKSNSYNEESPMNSFLAKGFNRRNQGQSTPSPRSKTSFTEESPHFNRGAKEFTPSSNGKNSGVENFRNELTGAHVISFGDHGQHLFRSNNLQNQLNQKAEASSMSNISGASYKANGGRVLQETESQRGSSLMTGQFFSFQQGLSPKDKEPPKSDRSGGEYHTDTIEEMEDDVRSSRDEVHQQLKGNSDNSSQKYIDHSDEEDDEFEQYAQRIQKGSYESQPKNNLMRKSSEKRLDGLYHKVSQNSNGSYADSKDYGTKFTPSMMPHYSHFFQKGKTIDLKQSPSNKKTDAKTSTSTNQRSNRNFEQINVPSFKLDDLGSKKNSNKEDSLATNYLIDQKELIKTILQQNHQSKESSSSLAKSSKGKEFFSSQLDSELFMKSREYVNSSMAKQNGDLAKGVMSLDSRALGRQVPQAKAFDKKVQSTGVPVLGEPEHKNERYNHIHDPMNDPEKYLKSGINTTKVSRSPLRSGLLTERDRDATNVGKQPHGAYKEQAITSKVRLSREEFKPLSQNPGVTNSYLDKFQKKNQPIDGRGTLDGLKKTQAGPLRAKDIDKQVVKQQFQENNFDKFMNETKKLPITPRGKLPAKPHPHPGPRADFPGQEALLYSKFQTVNPQLKKQQNPLKDMIEAPMQPPVQQHPQPEKIVRPIPLLENIMSKPVTQKRVESPKLRRKRPTDQPLMDLTNTVDGYADRVAQESQSSSRPGAQKLAENFYSGNYPGLPRGTSNEEMRLAKQRTDPYHQEDQAYRSQPFTGVSQYNGPSHQHQGLSALQRQASSRDFAKKTTQTASGGFNIRIDINDLSSKMIANIQRNLEE